MIQATAKHLCVLFLLFWALTPMALAQECYDYQNTFQVADPYPVNPNIKLLTGDLDRGLAGIGNSLVFLDLSNPQAIVEMGQFDIGEMAVRAESLNYKAVVQGSSNLYFMDWSDPTTPVVSPPLPLPSGLLRFTYINDQLLVSRGDQGVDIYQCTPELELVFLHNIATPGTANDATIDRGWLVVADQEALNILDISNPAAPVLVNSYDNYGGHFVENNVRYVDKATDHLVVAAVNWQGEEEGGPAPGLEVMSLDFEGNVSFIDKTYLPSTEWPEYAVTGNQLHVSSTYAYLLFELDSYPEETIHQEHSGIGTKSLLVSEKTLLYQEEPGILSVFEIEYPFIVGPQFDWNGADFHDIGGGQLRGKFLLKKQVTSYGLYSVYLYDIRDLLNPVQVGSEIWEETYISDVAEGMVLIKHDYSCILYDLRGDEVLQTTLPYGGWATFDGTRIYQTTYDFDSITGFAILDASTPGTVTELGFVSCTGYNAPFVLHENIVAHCDGGWVDGNFILYDVSDPSYPIILDVLSGVHGGIVGRIDNLLFLSADSASFICIDASNTSELSILWEIPGMRVRHLSIDGTVGAVSYSDPSTTSDLCLYDLTANSNGPTVLGPSIPIESAAVYSSLLNAGTLYTDSMEVFDVTNASQPKYLGRGTAPAGRGMYRKDNFIVTTSGCFPVQCNPTSAVDEGQALLPFASLLQLAASPNPFNPQTVVKFVLPEAANVRLCVYDISGRKVRTLIAQHLEAGPQSMTWNGQDDLGRAQASGVYFARLEAGMVVEITKMALLR